MYMKDPFIIHLLANFAKCSNNMLVHIHVHIFVHIHVNMLVHIHVNIIVHIHVNMLVHIHVSMHLFMLLHIHVNMFLHINVNMVVNEGVNRHKDKCLNKSVLCYKKGMYECTDLVTSSVHELLIAAKKSLREK
jgi:hypothetical protein